MASVNEIFGFSKVVYCDSAVTEKTAGEQVANILNNLPDQIRVNLPSSAKEQLRETLYKLGILDSSGSYSLDPEWQNLWVHGGNELGGKYAPITQISFQTRIVKTGSDGNPVGDIYYGIVLYGIVLEGNDLLNEIHRIEEYTPGSDRGLWQSRIYDGGTPGMFFDSEPLETCIRFLQDRERQINSAR